MQRKFVYNFNVLNKYANEWDELFFRVSNLEKN